MKVDRIVFLIGEFNTKKIRHGPFVNNVPICAQNVKKVGEVRMFIRHGPLFADGLGVNDFKVVNVDTDCKYFAIVRVIVDKNGVVGVVKLAKYSPNRNGLRVSKKLFLMV